MQILYQTEMDQWGCTRYPILSVKHCCEDMASMMENEDMVFGYNNDEYKHTAKMFANCAYSEYGDIEYNSYPVRFCPFCGEMIEIKEEGGAG